MGAKLDGITICGKTGTVENYYRGVKQPNHGFFCGFAPRENPTIAIMCVVENSGRFGGTYAAPIVGFMLEKFFKDSIDSKRKERLEYYTNLNLIPPRIYVEMRTQDSLRHAKDSAYLFAKGYIKKLRDTLEIDDEEEKDAFDKMKKDKQVADTTRPVKDSGTAKPLLKSDGILQNEKKKPNIKDSSKI